MRGLACKTGRPVEETPLSNTESFIDEVTEEVRRERLFLMLKRYGWIGIVGVLALVGGAAYYEWQSHTARVKAETAGDAVLAALDLPQAAERHDALLATAGAGDSGALVRLLAAGEALASEDAALRDKAHADLAAIASDASLSPVWRDLASLRRLTLAGSALPEAERKAGLADLAQPGRPFRPMAQEQIAFDKMTAGDRDGALADFRALTNDREAPSALRGRAGQMIVLLGGDAAQAQPAGN